MTASEFRQLIESHPQIAGEVLEAVARRELAA
jgi:CRP-like cAMP-binding protein